VDGAGNVGVAASPPSGFAVFTDATVLRTLSAADASAYVRMTNGGANQVKIPANATAAIPVGTRIWIEQAGAGRTTVVADVGVTLRQSSTQAQLYLRAQFSQVWATKVGTDEWVLGGDFGGLLDYVVGTSVPANITSNEILLDHPVVRAFTIPANLAGSQASVGTNPAASFVITLLKNGVAFGTITIATSGFVSYGTTGGTAVTFAVGDLLTAQAPSTPDASIARLRFTIKGNN
jgi:3D (Asp-Asp-Asp) domain-containing protein